MASSLRARRRVGNGFKEKLGRILRPASGKKGAIVYTLVATGPEVGRLKEEEEDISDIATITWARG